MKTFILKGGISGGFKNPGIVETLLEPSLENLNTLERNNPDLKPETSLNYEAGFNFSNNENLNLNVMAFMTNFKDKIDMIFLCQSSNPTYGVPSTYDCNYNGRNYYDTRINKNLAGVRIYGVEFSLDYKVLDNLNLITNYTYAKSKITKGEDKGDPANSNPHHMLNVGIDYQALNNLGFWTQVTYNSKQMKQFWTDNKIVGSYATVDLGLVYDFSKNAKIRAGVTNLFDKNINSEGKYRQVAGTRFNLGINVNF